MCGICGIIGIENQADAMSIVARMMREMRHRGPDGEGQLTKPFACVGMRRLSIIDFPRGAQPIWNESETVAVFFNGEIFNFRELRRSLESDGHLFRTQSDTEVIVHAYEAWGEDCVHHFRGMFALAIVELPEGKNGPPRRIFLARDRMGIKPLYWAVANGKFLFASEVRALLASGCIPRQISRSALASYLLFGSVGEPLTLVESVQSVPPGHSGYVSCDAPDVHFRPTAYWDFPAAAHTEANRARSVSPAASLRSHLEEAVRQHLVADVPLGIFLSSGLDSNALAALASRAVHGIKTFTVTFPEEEFSEAELARRTASRLGTVHSELMLSGEEMRARLDEAIAAFDQPSMDGVNTFFVSWAAREAGLKVALSGLGSDEIFGGYDTFRSAPRLARLTNFSRLLPSRARKSISAAVRGWEGHSARPDAVRKLAAALANPDDFRHPYFYTRSLFSPESVKRLLRSAGEDWSPSAWGVWLAAAAEQTSNFDSFTAVSWLEIRTYLVSTLLRDTDSMSMRHSLEVRVPFLDHPLVEWTLGLPARAKIGNGERKALLIEALGDLLPPEIIRQPKRTFTLPWENWLRGPLRGQIESSLEDWCPHLDSIVDKNAVQSVWRQFLAGRTSWSRPWSLYVLNEWTRTNIEASNFEIANEKARVVQAGS
jgi:asparagine synthase (glutamine-hydrolysing)